MTDMPHPMVAKISIATLNAMPKDDFVAALRPIFDEIDDPWIAERAWASAPFRDVVTLHQAMVAAVDRACTHDQLELLARQDDLETRKNGLYFRRFSPEQQVEVREA
ncbi:MAG: 2-oxo-4-hydroxy-4-carboxy-5-ureidoimidazoline decarboxylase, partial [Pseudomonadota bacterium]